MSSTILLGLGAISAKEMLRGAGGYFRRKAKRREKQEQGLRMLGSVLFGLRMNLERARLIASREDQIFYAPCNLSVSNGVMPRLSEVVHVPPILNALQVLLSGVERIDFFQRQAAQKEYVNADGQRVIGGVVDHGKAKGFAEDLIGKGHIDIFNRLVVLANDAGLELFGEKEWKDVGPCLVPEQIDVRGEIDHSLL